MSINYCLKRAIPMPESAGCISAAIGVYAFFLKNWTRAHRSLRLRLLVGLLSIWIGVDLSSLLGFCPDFVCQLKAASCQLFNTVCFLSKCWKRSNKTYICDI